MHTPPPFPTPANDPTPGAPFALAELRACLYQPHRTLDVVLAERARLVASVRDGRDLLALVALLALCSIAFAVPFAAVDGSRRLGHVALLFLGSVLLCFPSLQVFGSYLGIRLSLAQNFAISLVIPSAAALFTFGFFPIYWFLDVTMPPDGAFTGTTTRVVLLVCSMLLALSHCNRCLFLDPSLKAFRSSWPLWIGWQVLLLFITYRMANTLGMFA